MKELLEKIIVPRVCEEFGVTEAQLKAPTRGVFKIAWARQVAMYLTYVCHGSTSYTAVGRLFGRDRTTVRHACEIVENWRGEGEDLHNFLEGVERECSAASI